MAYTVEFYLFFIHDCACLDVCVPIIVKAKKKITQMQSSELNTLF